MILETKQIKRIIEGALLAAAEPLSISDISQILGDGNNLDNKELCALIEELGNEYINRGIELKRVASGYRFQVCADLSPWISRLWEERPPRYSRALLETLALIAYRQPVTRAEIEDVRGVAAGTNIIRTLIEREWIKIAGHKDVPGKPALYVTTDKFLDYFNLKSLKELPILEDLPDLNKAAVQLELKLTEDQGSNS